LFDEPPPENDDEASKLGKKIREWIKNGRLKPGETKHEEDVHKHDKEEKPEKKRGRFGFLRK